VLFLIHPWQRFLLFLAWWMLLVCCFCSERAKAQQLRTPAQSGEKPVKVVGPFLSREDLDEYTKVVLKNGLTAILYERKEVPLVSISTYVKAGYLEEPDPVRGIAHVLEHMFFKGTTRRGVGQLAKETKTLGGYLNAGTYYEYTHYYTVLPSEHFRQGLDIQADALQNPLLAEDELKREVQVILQEARRKADAPDAFALEKLYEIAFEVSPLRRWRIGDETTLLPLRRKELAEFYQKWYVPSNIILVVCGNFERRSALEEIVRRYGPMTQGKSERAMAPAEPPQERLRYRQLRGDIGEARALLGFSAPAAFSNEWYACQVFQAILAEGETSILNRQLKQDRGWVSSVGVSSLDLKRQGYVTFRLSLHPAHLDRAELALFAELEKVKSGGLADEDLERAKNLLERKAYENREELGDFSFQLAHYDAIADYRELRESIRKVRGVTREQVIQVAKSHFTLANCTLLEYLPAGLESRNVTPKSLSAYFEEKLPTAVRELEEREDAAASSISSQQKTPSRSQVPPTVASQVSSAWVDTPLTQYSILRGPEVMVKESRALPLVSTGIFFPGGRVFEGRSNNGITELMVRASIKGTLKMDAMQLLAAFERNGANLETRVEPDFFGYVLTGLKTNFEQNLSLLLSMLKEPKFEEAQIEKEKALLLAEASRVADHQVLFSRQLLKQALYGDHPYGLPALGTPDSISRLTRQGLIEWHSQFVKKAVPVVVIVGDTEGSELVSGLSGQLSSSGTEAIDLKMALPVKALDRESQKVETREKQQSATFLGLMTPGISEPETRVLTVVANLVSGLGGRFFEEVREKQGLAYTVNAAYETAALGGCFTTYVATSPENRQRAIDAIREQIKRLSSDRVSEAELIMARTYTSGSWKMRLLQRRSQVFEFARLKIAGLSLDEIREYSNQFDFIRPETIREVCQKFFDLNHLAVGGTLGSGQNRESSP
jgi:zinc protease